MMNQNIRNGEMFLNFNPSMKNLEEPLRNSIRDTYDELSGANTTAMRNFEIMIILAYKD